MTMRKSWLVWCLWCCLSSGWSELSAASWPGAMSAPQAQSDYSSVLKAAQAAYGQGDFARAEKQAIALTVLDEARWEGHMLLGAALAKQGKAGAAESFAAAKTRAPAEKHAGIDEVARLAGQGKPAGGGDGAPATKAPASPAPASGEDKMKLAVVKSITKQLDATQDAAKRQPLLRELLAKTEALPNQAEARCSVLFVRAMAALELGEEEVGWQTSTALREVDAASQADEGQMEILAQLERKGWNSREKPTWFEVVAQDPDPAVVPDAAVRTRIAALKLPWKVRHKASGVVLVLIPTGEFLMGSPKDEAGREPDETQHSVRIEKPFYMGVTEVTQAQWQRVMGHNPSFFRNPDGPVEQVSWDDCQTFVKKAGGGLRLPSESEWEYACRAGTTTPFSFGATISTDQVNYDGNYTYGTGSKGVYREWTVACGSMPANAWGLHEMHGNVWEWCEDGYGEYPSAGTQVAAGVSGAPRVLRGGSWYGSPDDCRSANRDRFGAVIRNDVGFRVARTIAP